jgi:hypothetical protein
MLNYSRDNSCLISDGMKLCKDVSLPAPALPTCTSLDYSALSPAFNACYNERAARLCSACTTCCTGSTPNAEYTQSTDPTCYSCASTKFGVSRARDYYDGGGNYYHLCSDCATLSSAYLNVATAAQAGNCSITAGWQICKDVSAS